MIKHWLSSLSLFGGHAAMLGGVLNAPGVLLLASALVTIAIAVQTLRIPAFAGRAAVSGALLSAGAWSFGAAMDTMPLSAATKMVWASLLWAPSLAVPGYMLMFSWQYVRGEQRGVPLTWQAPHWAMVAVTVGITLDNPRLHLMYLSTDPLSPGGPTDFVHGPWFFIAVTYGYVLLLLALSIVLEAMSRSRGLHRRQYAGIALAMVLPWLASLCNTFDLVHLFGVDPTPISFLVASAIIAFLLKKARLFTLVPVARAVLVEAIPDPVLVIDLGHQVVDANAAAFAMLEQAGPIIGRQLTDIVLLTPLHGLARGEAPPAELALGPDNRFEITLMTLTHGDRQVGQMLLLRDVSRRVRLKAALREDRARDSLTAPQNRNLTEEVGRQLVLKADQQGQKLAIILIDLDYVKRFNDHHGHQAGDRLLVAVAGFLSERVRQSDLVLRTAGEEILILLPGASGDQALARIDGWRGDFAVTEIDIGPGRVQSTFSAGIAVYPEDGASLDEVMIQAGKALYRAKEEGRNRACLWKETHAQHG